VKSASSPLSETAVRLWRGARWYSYLFWHGQWYHFAFKLRAILRHLDLKQTSTEELGLPSETVYYSASSGGAALAHALRRMPIASSDAVLDVGCGKGGALITLSDFPFGRVAGLELSETLVGVARANLRRLGRTTVVVYCGDALEFANYDDYSHIYLYNPFPPVVMAPFLRCLAASLQRRPRRLTLIYKNPTCHDQIIGSGHFDFTNADQLGSDHPVHLYQSKGVVAGDSVATT